MEVKYSFKIDLIQCSIIKANDKRFYNCLELDGLGDFGIYICLTPLLANCLALVDPVNELVFELAHVGFRDFLVRIDLDRDVFRVGSILPNQILERLLCCIGIDLQVESYLSIHGLAFVDTDPKLLIFLHLLRGVHSTSSAFSGGLEHPLHDRVTLLRFLEEVADSLLQGAGHCRMCFATISVTVSL